LAELAKKVKESSVGADVRVAMLEAEKKELQRREYGLDIAFLMDCTGSMSSWIKAAKNHVRTIMTEAIKINDKVIPRIAFVGYRDHCDGAERLTIIDFQGMSQAEDLRNQVNKIK
jgi:Mg-chelatase subunit ChlD